MAEQVAVGSDERRQFANQITMAWQSSVAAIIEVGKLLAEAKRTLPHGEFGAMIENDLPFGARAAQMLMAIANHRGISNTKHVSHLPASWGTLYELTKLGDDEFEARVQDGTINAEMKREDVKATKEKPLKKSRSDAGPRSGDDDDREPNYDDIAHSRVFEIHWYDMANEALENIAFRLQGQQCDVRGELMAVRKFINERLAVLWQAEAEEDAEDDAVIGDEVGNKASLERP
jgi:hypothetical protein